MAETETPFTLLQDTVPSPSATCENACTVLVMDFAHFSSDIGLHQIHFDFTKHFKVVLYNSALTVAG